MKFSKAFATIIALSAGWITLLGYFGVPFFTTLSQVLLMWASMLMAVGVLVGVINLFVVHSHRVTVGTRGWAYSLVTVVAILAVVILNITTAVLASPLMAFLKIDIGLGTGPAGMANQWIFRYIQVAGGTAFAGLLFFFLVLAGYRILYRRVSIMHVTFVIVAVLVLLGFMPWPTGTPDLTILRDVRVWLTQVPAMAGARGILLGVALGVIATGLRTLLAQDRPYRE